jgi:hypothetical protein
MIVVTNADMFGDADVITNLDFVARRNVAVVIDANVFTDRNAGIWRLCGKITPYANHGAIANLNPGESVLNPYPSVELYIFANRFKLN